LIAGLSSALVALLCVGLGTTRPDLAQVSGMILAAGLAVFFGLRFQKSRKLMPSGLMAGMSMFVVLVLLWLRIYQAG
jgi:uncharacterized membrane protein (UPF0136 family)